MTKIKVVCTSTELFLRGSDGWYAYWVGEGRLRFGKKGERNCCLPAWLAPASLASLPLLLPDCARLIVDR